MFILVNKAVKQLNNDVEICKKNFEGKGNVRKLNSGKKVNKNININIIIIINIIINRT